MTIEEIRTHLNRWAELIGTKTVTPDLEIQKIMDSIVQIRTDAYDEGWDDAMGETE